MRLTAGAILLLAVACGRPAPKPARPATPAPPARWSVAFERSIGPLGTSAVFTADGGVVSSGLRFDRDGRYLETLAMEVGGGRMISHLRAILRDGRGVAAVSDDVDDQGVLVGRADRAPEEATARSHGTTALTVSADERRAAAFVADAIQIWSLPELARIERIEIGASPAMAALGLVPGGVAYSTACRGEGCTGVGLEIHDAGGVRTLREAGIEALSFAPTGDAAVVHDGRALEVLALPGGESLGRIPFAGEVEGGITDAGALAVAPGGATVAALSCATLSVWTRTETGWEESYRDTATTPAADCLYPSGLTFSADGGALALSGDDLTVLRPGSPGAAPALAYRPALPDGFEVTEEVRGIYMPTPGTGLAAAPRVLGAWEAPGVMVRAIARDAAEMSGFVGLDAWATALVTRFDAVDWAEVTDRRAYLDGAGRRVLEYTVLVRGGCEEMDRHVRWIEVGASLLEIDIEAVPGEEPATTRAWMASFFDAALGDEPRPERIVSTAGFHRGGC